ncbi:DUF2268 domain-containing putative Zn-dependent protease [Paracoccus onubensis]|uniref:DUF2268 domain-containing putative Zn-dependent protease n=1 Tax=Paracoccus onubensis TaxID=1675788 RepID=UPI001600E98E|nr:DUF2268 domain-containing putative Zn-dependent protease [Paracoccus onubensis]
MTIWHIHMLNARHGLTHVLPDIRLAAREAVAAASSHAELPDFDLVIKAQPGGGIPAWGVGGRAPSPGLIEITVDPARFAAPLLIRTLVHEFHHLLRWDGPGYGNSLGEALVSEGLAGHFTLQVLGGKPDPWDAVKPAARVARAAMNKWARLDYNHAHWFFGSGELRRWTGYGLGHMLITEHLSRFPDMDAVKLAYVKAEEFRPAMRRLAGAEAAAGDDPAEDGAGEADADADPAPDAADEDSAAPEQQHAGGEVTAKESGAEAAGTSESGPAEDKKG